jgi:hypothetical protein
VPAAAGFEPSVLGSLVECPTHYVIGAGQVNKRVDPPGHHWVVEEGLNSRGDLIWLARAGNAKAKSDEVDGQAALKGKLGIVRCLVATTVNKLRLSNNESCVTLHIVASLTDRIRGIIYHTRGAIYTHLWCSTSITYKDCLMTIVICFRTIHRVILIKPFLA